MKREMAGASVISALLISIIARCSSEITNGYSSTHGFNNGNNGQFGELLKPPPPPLLPIVPVPFHSGVKLDAGSISQRQNYEEGYQYLPPPPPTQLPPVLPPPTANDFKFPAPFYKQYNFNFVPPPQPFTTTPSPSVFQKFSSWLFPTQDVSYDSQSAIINNYNAATFKKDCNPCNLVPWIPVIRYDLAAKNVRSNNDLSPTYGPPSPTASSSLFNSVQNVPQPFTNQNFGQYSNYNKPFDTYGPPKLTVVASTYGPPSPTHTLDASHPQLSLSSPSVINTNSYSNLPYTTQTTTSAPVRFNELPHYSNALSSSAYGLPSTTYSTPFLVYDNNILTTTASPISASQQPDVFNQQFPHQNDVEVFTQNVPSQELQLPKVTRPIGFKNSYGDPIGNSLDIPYAITATGAASSKIKTEVWPNSDIRPNVENMSLALANPAPFSLNKGRNIHTLQPVALPNLSISPLPPIFNARPFRPVTSKYFANILYGSNQKQSDSNRVSIAQSVPLVEYTHSIEYPTTFVQSPVIEIDASQTSENHTKGYRNLPNRFVIDDIRDISPQASDHHVSATTSNKESSFESTGPDIENELYDGGMPSELSSKTRVPSNHKPAFADLRNVKDDDVDKYRTENNLQHIDSPLLYLKPSAPHKNYKNFSFFVSTPGNDREYEIYDENPTTQSPIQPNPSTTWDGSHTYTDDPSITSAQQSTNQAKILQIIVPYTINQKDFTDKNHFEIRQESQARKVQTDTEKNFVTISTNKYDNIRTTTEDPISTVTDQYDYERINTPGILNDLYDVKEPPFDIIKLQHTIDDWTEQEYSNSNHYNEPKRVRSNEKYAKQIPDHFFTTISPVTDDLTETNNYNYDIYDHEFSSSNQELVTENKTNILSKTNKGYNNIERTKVNYASGKNDDERLHIYTVPSTVYTTTTTLAPWGKIPTSISPLTNEKVYVVTSKPWREKINNTNEFENFESKKTNAHSHISAPDEVLIKPPKSFYRPSNGFRTDGRLKSTKFDTSYTYTNGWHRRINNLDKEMQNEYPEGDTVILDEELTYKTTNGTNNEDEVKLE